MEIKIKNQTWSIIFFHNSSFYQESSDKETIYYGQTNYLNQQIYIHMDLSIEQQKQTLIHELTHAFMHVYGFGEITEEIPIEIMCDFMGCYAEDIVSIANEVIKNE